MELIHDAQTVLKKAWSVKLALLSAVSGVAEVVLPYFGGLLPPKTMAIVAVVTAIGSVAARLVHQPEMH